MEEAFSCSLNVCKLIVQNDLFNKLAKQLPPSKSQLKLFSSKKAERVADMLVEASRHLHDIPAPKISEDVQIKNQKSRSFVVHKRKQQMDAKTMFHQKETSQTELMKKRVSSKFNEFGLVALNLPEEKDEESEEQEDIQGRMREVKMHQQHIRTKFMESVKQGKNRKHFTQHKTEGKSVPKMGIYEFDGSLIQPLKADSIRYPGHYLDLEVHVHQKENHTVSSNLKKGKKGNKNVRFQSFPRNKEELRYSESIFLQQLNKVQWAQGVSVMTGKEECRNILGYSQSRNVKRKRVDLWKQSQEPIKMKMEDLQNYKGLAQRGSNFLLNVGSAKNFFPEPPLFVKQENSKLMQGPRTIKVQNNRALQFLMKDLAEQQVVVSKKSEVGISKKAFNSYHNCSSVKA